MHRLSDHIYWFEDTCNVFVIIQGKTAVLIDFGSGDVLSHLDELGIDQVTDVLMTHHHRDQAQGLAKAVAAGARVWVPHCEQDLFAHVDQLWQSREIYNNYNVRQDRFSLLDPVSISGTLRDYKEYQFGTTCFKVQPTPGHTPGSITLLAEIDRHAVAFSGDLIAAPGKVWSLAATQWTYNGAEGMAYSIPALLDLKKSQPDLLLPAHGGPITNPGDAIDQLIARFEQILHARGDNLNLCALQEHPYEVITPHLLRSRANVAVSYVLLSQSGKALMIDFGYDFSVGFISGSDRASRRPWLHTLPALKEQFGVSKVDVVIPTHTHDDHVAGLNLLREVEGARIWASEEIARVLEDPASYDLPCLWYDPIPVDRILPTGYPCRWEEYLITLYPLPGHSQYSVAIAFEVDGKRALATGDQYQGNNGLKFNYVFQNRYHLGDYAAGARLYKKLSPDLILPGHWQPLWVSPGYLDQLVENADRLEHMESELLHDAISGFDAEGVGARIYPYQTSIRSGETCSFEVELHNPFPSDAMSEVKIIAPDGWKVSQAETHFKLAGHASQAIHFTITVPDRVKLHRARLAVDLTIGNQRFGQQAEALVDVT